MTYGSLLLIYQIAVFDWLDILHDLVFFASKRMRDNNSMFGWDQ
jgi:hypothetical protein